MHGIKIPQQDFALKTQGGLCVRGGHICGILRYLNLSGERLMVNAADTFTIPYMYMM